MSDLAGAFSPEEQAAFDAMRDADTAPATIEPAAPDTVEPIAPAAEPAAADPQQQRPQMVPHAALHQEREEHKATKANLAAERQRLQTLEERTNLLLQGMGQQRQPQPAEPQQQPLPPLEQDPVGHLVGAMRQQGVTMQALQQAQQQQTMQSQMAAQIAALQNEAVAREHEFRATTPDYDAATNWLRGRREQTLEAMGYNASERANLLHQESLGIAARALQMGQNPASMIYAIAKGNGYTGAAQTASDGSDSAPQAAAPPATPAAPASPERLQQIAAGQQQGRSLGQARGTGPVPLTTARLLEMSDNEFHEKMKTPEGRALLGI